MFHWIRKWKQDRQQKKIKETDLPNAWTIVKQIWGKANTVYIGPVGFFPTLMFEYLAVSTFVKSHPGCEIYLIEGLSDPNPFVCAYCLVALKELHSPALLNLPQQLLDRNDQIEWMLCNRSVITTLGKFAETFDPEYSPPIQSFEIEKKWKSSKTIS